MTTERKSALPRTELDRASRERLERLIGVDKEALTPADKAFLTARRMYLSAAEREDLGIGEPEAGGDNTPPNTNEPNGGDAPDKYDAFTGLEGHKALKAELESRNLPTDGKIDELRERLRADDKAKAEAGAGTE